MIRQNGGADMTIGENIKELRLKKQLTQAELAEIIGVSRQAIQKYETGESGVGSDKIEKLAKFFHVSPASIMGWYENEEIDTIAAHKNNPDEEWTEEELKEIEEFKKFVKMKRQSRK